MVFSEVNFPAVECVEYGSYMTAVRCSTTSETGLKNAMVTSGQTQTPMKGPQFLFDFSTLKGVLIPGPKR